MLIIIESIAAFLKERGIKNQVESYGQEFNCIKIHLKDEKYSIFLNFNKRVQNMAWITAENTTYIPEIKTYTSRIRTNFGYFADPSNPDLLEEILNIVEYVNGQ